MIDPKLRASIVKDESDFALALERYQSLIGDDRNASVSGLVKAYSEFSQVGHQMMELTDRKRRDSRELVSATQQITEVLDRTDLARNNNSWSKWSRALRRMRDVAAEINGNRLSLALSEPQALKGVLQKANEDFQEYSAELKTRATRPSEGATIRAVDDLVHRILQSIDEGADIIQDELRLEGRLIALSHQLDDILDDVIQVQAKSDLLNAQQQADMALQRVRLVSLLGLPILIVIGLAAGAFLIKRINVPIDQLVSAFQEVGMGKLATRFPTIGHGELGQLRQEFNMMVGQLEKRTDELAAANRELETFSYSVAHDLRAPLISIDGFAQKLTSRLLLDDESRRITSVLRRNVRTMSELIDSLLTIARLSRQEIRLSSVDLTALSEQIVAEQLAMFPEISPVISIDALPPAVCDPAMMRIVMSNLVGNAIKYSSKRERPIIRIFCTSVGSTNTYCVQDNGSGFDMAYAGKLFGLFQRLHSNVEFPGTGVGLAIVDRLIDRLIGRQGGRVWAEGVVDSGASFYFTLLGVRA